jgi:response regulator of citrate/malate metabolism
MPTIPTKTLQAGLDAGLFSRPLLPEELLYLPKSITTPAAILAAIRDTGSISNTDLAQKLGFSPVSIGQYCGWLESKELISAHREGRTVTWIADWSTLTKTLGNTP